MKVLFLIDALHKGGKERRMLELIKDLLRNSENEVELVLFRDLVGYPQVRELNLKLHILERRPKANPLVFFRLMRICRAFRPDIMHSWSTISSLYGLAPRLLMRIPLINGNIAKAPKGFKIWHKEYFLARLTFLFSDRVIGNSKAGLIAYRAPKKKSICIPNGFDFTRHENLKPPNILEREYNLKGRQVVGMIGAFAPRKDYKTYLKAAELVLDQLPETLFFAVGDGPMREDLEKSWPSHLSTNMVFTGNIADVESLIQCFDIGILTTNDQVHGEGISNAILEYMAAGITVVATNGGGTPEIVEDGHTGYLITPGDSAELAARIISLLGDPAQRKQMGKAGHYRIKKQFNLADMTEHYLKVYRKVLSL